MPLVFAMNESSESGISYEDVPYVSYEFPTMYRNQIVPGEAFVYYRGRRRATGGRQRQVYLGTGIVGPIRPSSTPGRLVCDVLDGRPFDQPLFFRDDEGATLEPDGARRGYYQRGVRRIDEATFERIVTLAASTSPYVEPAGQSDPAPRGPYATAEVARRVEDYSRRVATTHLARELSCDVEAMPLNHPGFDLRTSDPRVTFIEVKGTQSPIPRFFMSEGERRFAAEHGAQYALIVVSGIDLERETHRKLDLRPGPVEASARLEVERWAGVLRDETPTL